MNMQSIEEWMQIYQENNISSMPELAFNRPFHAANNMAAIPITNQSILRSGVSVESQTLPVTSNSIGVRNDAYPNISVHSHTQAPMTTGTSATGQLLPEPWPTISSLSSDGGGLVPKGSNGKPFRRRSRNSKRTPTTLLNANTNNFRALVQQFTGCHSTSSLTNGGNYKGPINLNFGKYNSFSEKPDQPQQLHTKSDRQSFVSFGNTNDHNISAATTTTATSTVLDINNSRTEHQLNLDDDFDMDSFSLENILEHAGYNYNPEPGTSKKIIMDFRDS